MNLTKVDGFWCRDGTVDANAVYTLADDEYRLWHRQWSGWAIDVGAQIGTIGITLARRNPDLRVICVEAVPESSDLLERNIEGFGVGDRVFSERAWAGAPGQTTGTCFYGYRGGDVESDSYVSAHRYVGNTWQNLRDPESRVELPAVSLPGLMASYGIDDVAVLKIDCEGCEWSFLDTPVVGFVGVIAGEYHGGYPGHPAHQPDPVGRIRELLEPTHDLTFYSDVAPVGTFEAVRR